MSSVEIDDSPYAPDNYLQEMRERIAFQRGKEAGLNQMYDLWDSARSETVSSRPSFVFLVVSYVSIPYAAYSLVQQLCNNQ